MWVKSPPDAEKAQWVEVAPPEILPHKVGESTYYFLLRKRLLRRCQSEVRGFWLGDTAAG